MLETFFTVGSYILWVGLALGILIFVHELGHFLTAKYFGMRVERFSIGFPPKLYGWQKGETEYMLGAIPLGGYVKVSGMIDESLDTEGIAEDPEPYEYRAKPVWQRMIFVSAGVLFNMILAGIVYVGLNYSHGEAYLPMEEVGYVTVADSSLAGRMGLQTGDRPVAVNGDSLRSFNQLFAPRYLTADRMRITVLRDGERRTFTAPPNVISQVSSIESGPQSVDQKFGLFLPPRVGRVLEESAAERAGLRTGDIVLSIGGRSTISWQDLTEAVQASGGDTVRVRWRRTAESGAVDTLVARVAPQEQNGSYLLGIGHGYQESSQFREYGPVEAVRAGVVETGQTTMAILQNFKKIVVGSESFRQNVGGPVIIAKFTKQAAEQGPYQFWSLVAMLSITLAILNILPFPVLDGGHLMFLLYEAIVRREPSLKVRMALQQIGMVILLGFMVFVIINDIMRL